MVGGFDVDGGAEARLVNKYVNIQEGDMGRGDGPSKSDRIATNEALKEEEKRIMTMSDTRKLEAGQEVKERLDRNFLRAERP